MSKKQVVKKKVSSKPQSSPKKKRVARPYPASSFEDALQLGKAIMQYAKGDEVRRLTLMGSMGKSPDSGPTRTMITNSGKYKISVGSYTAEFLKLTDLGRTVVDEEKSEHDRRQAAFNLAIVGVKPFAHLYEHYKGKRLPEREIVKDVLRDSGIEVPDKDECVDTFTVNAKYLGLLKTIGGAETLVSIEQVLDEFEAVATPVRNGIPSLPLQPTPVVGVDSENVDWKTTCFYITPIGAEDSEERKHSDLFLSSLVQPALEELGLSVVRADKISEAGMITSQVLEYLKRSQLAIADLSYLNPNVFYEVALRHSLRLPVVQLIRKVDRLPFDVNQARTLVFDTTDIYTLVPKLQTYRAEIANQARKALEDPESVGNPVSVFYPAFFE